MNAWLVTLLAASAAAPASQADKPERIRLNSGVIVVGTAEIPITASMNECLRLERAGDKKADDKKADDKKTDKKKADDKTDEVFACQAVPPGVDNKLEKTKARIMITLDRPPPTRTRLSFDGTTNDAHAEVEWEPISSGQLGRVVSLPPGAWRLSVWSEPQRSVDGTSNYAWDPDPTCSGFSAVGLDSKNKDIYALSLDESPFSSLSHKTGDLATCMGDYSACIDASPKDESAAKQFSSINHSAAQGTTGSTNTDSTKTNSTKTVSNLLDLACKPQKSAFYETIAKTCRAVKQYAATGYIPKSCYGASAREFGRMRFDVLIRPSLEEAAHSISQADGGGPQLDGRSFAAGVQQQAEEIVQVLGEIVVEKAQTQAYDTLRDRLVNVICNEMKLPRETAVRYFGKGAEAWFGTVDGNDETVDSLELLPASCRLLSKTRLQDLVGTRRELIRALTFDAAAFAMQVARLGIDQEISLAVAEQTLTRASLYYGRQSGDADGAGSGGGIDVPRIRAKWSEASPTKRLADFEAFLKCNARGENPLLPLQIKACAGGPNALQTVHKNEKEELERVTAAIMEELLSIARDVAVQGRSPRLHPLALLSRLAVPASVEALADGSTLKDFLKGVLERPEGEKRYVMAFSIGRAAMRSALAAIGECQRTSGCDARQIRAYLETPERYFDVGKSLLVPETLSEKSQAAAKKVPEEITKAISAAWPDLDHFVMSALSVLQPPKDLDARGRARLVSDLAFDVLTHLPAVYVAGTDGQGGLRRNRKYEQLMSALRDAIDGLLADQPQLLLASMSQVLNLTLDPEPQLVDKIAALQVESKTVRSRFEVDHVAPSLSAESQEIIAYVRRLETCWHDRYRDVWASPDPAYKACAEGMAQALFDDSLIALRKNTKGAAHDFRKAAVRFTTFAGALAAYVAPVPPNANPDEVKSARKKAIEAVVDSSTSRDGRDGDWVVGFAGTTGVEAGFRLFDQHGFATSPSLSLGLSIDRVPEADGTCFGARCSFLLHLGILDLGQYLSFQDNTVAKPEVLQAFSPSLMGGVRFSGGVPFFIGLRARLLPKLADDGPRHVAAGQLGLVIGAHVPLFDLN